MSGRDVNLGRGSQSSLEKAELRPGDFTLRKGDRQLYANTVVLSGGAGSGNELRLRRSASVVETPTFDEPKLWRIEMLFTAPDASPAVTVPAPWVPNPISPDLVKVTVRRSTDRDKSVEESFFLLSGISISDATEHALPLYVVRGFQVGVKAEIVGSDGISPPGGAAHIGVVGSIVEVSSGGQDPERNAAQPATFEQGAGGTQVFLQPNQYRKQFIVVNDGSAPLYVSFDESAIAHGVGARFAFILANRGDVYESPPGGWQGFVSGAWGAASADPLDGARVTEVT